METIETSSKNHSSKIVNFIFMALVAVGLVLIVYKNKDNFSQYQDALMNINYWTMLVVLLLTVVAILFRNWSWYFLLLPVKKDISFLNLFRISINALVADFTVPGKLGVPVKAILLKKTESIEVGNSLPSIFGEIFIEHSSAIFIAAISVLIGGHLTIFFQAMQNIVQAQGILQYALILIGMLGTLLLIGCIFRKKLQRINFVQNFIHTFHITRKRLDYLSLSYFITIVNLIVSYYVVWLVLRTLGHPEIEITFIIFAGTITNLISLISPIPGGVGVKEITIYGMYDLYFHLGGIAFLALLIMRLVTYLSLFLCFLSERAFSGLILARKKKEYVLTP
ncbi:MAG: flippase-like domain-containing protein [candidate division KSB1 bacterium]|nr:flippase-like domain-containing protein [candidate division KSB1 bacterium]MDZ7341198.1 flippase-like domain-containing protein [candidate division KSB1 bacterium]